MAYLNVQVGYPIVALSDLISREEIDNAFSTMSRYLPKIMVEAGIVSSTSEVRRNRPDLCKTYPDDMTTCEEIKWGKKRLYVVVGKKEPINWDEMLAKDPNVHSWAYLDESSIIYTNPDNYGKLCIGSQYKYGISMMLDSKGNNIPASGKEYGDGMIINYC